MRWNPSCLMLRLRAQWHEYHVDPPQLWKLLSFSFFLVRRMHGHGSIHIYIQIILPA
jgi:hypothetical protein